MRMHRNSCPEPAAVMISGISSHTPQRLKASSKVLENSRLKSCDIFLHSTHLQGTGEGREWSSHALPVPRHLSSTFCISEDVNRNIMRKPTRQTKTKNHRLLTRTPSVSISTGLWNWLQSRVHGNSILRRISCSTTLKHQQLHLENEFKIDQNSKLFTPPNIPWLTPQSQTTCAIIWMPNSLWPDFLSS